MLAPAETWLPVHSFLVSLCLKSLVFLGLMGLKLGFRGVGCRLELSNFALFGVAELLPPAWCW